MRLSSATITVTELQDAIREYVERNANSQLDEVYVDNGYGKLVLIVPLKPGTVVQGEYFQRKTGVS